MVFLSSARLDSLVVTKKAVLRTCWDLSTWNNTCFLFKCRVKFWLGWLSEATFGTLVFLRRVCDISYHAKKTVHFLEMWSLSFWKCTIVLMVTVQSFLKRWKGWPMPPKPRHKLSQMSLSPSKNIALSCARSVSLLWEVREIDLREVLPVLVVILVVFSVFLFQQRQCPTELEKWPWSVCVKFYGQKDLRKDYFY